MDRIMTDAIVHVWDKAAEKECTLRTAAYIVACERILMARKDRGIYRADPHQQPHQGGLAPPLFFFAAPLTAEDVRYLTRSCSANVTTSRK